MCSVLNLKLDNVSLNVVVGWLVVVHPGNEISVITDSPSSRSKLYDFLSSVGDER